MSFHASHAGLQFTEHVAKSKAGDVRGSACKCVGQSLWRFFF